MSLIPRKNTQAPYNLRDYVQTAKSDPKRAAKEIAGAVILGIILFAFCFLMGTQ
jgi:hypothetical protein